MGDKKLGESFAKSEGFGRGRPSNLDDSQLLARKHKITHNFCIHFPIFTKRHKLAGDSALTAYICAKWHSPIAPPSSGWKRHFVYTPRIWSNFSYTFNDNGFKLGQLTLKPWGIKSYKNFFQNLKGVAMAGRRRSCYGVCGLKAISSSQGHETWHTCPCWRPHMYLKNIVCGRRKMAL